MRSTLIQICGLLVVALLAAGCAAGTPVPTGTPTADDSTLGMGLANPASVNCSEKGGTLTIVKRGDGGEYGICSFENNFQCEEWAMMNGACPVGGVDVSGFATPQAVYCAITGGTYSAGENAGTSDEKGTCTFKSGSTCDALDYFNGVCSSGA